MEKMKEQRDNARFLDAIRRIEAQECDLSKLISVAEELRSAGEFDLALVLYKFWLLANPTNPARYGAAFNCAVHLLNAGDAKAAKTFFSQAIAANPDFYPARQSLALACEQAGDLPTAIAEWQQILERLNLVSPENIGSKIMTLRNLARVQRGSGAGETALRMAIEIDSNQNDLVQHWVNQRQGRCLWPVLEPVGPLTVKDVLIRLAPLSMAIHTDDPLLQLGAARRYSRQLEKRPDIGVSGEWPVPGHLDRERIRVAYLSSDFCQHAVGYLMMDVFAHHDRQRFEISVFNIGDRNNDPIQQKIMGKVDQWIDLRGVPDKLAAGMILDRGIDILLDMNGHTNHQRTQLLALKPAPIIANWLGYPGTMGSDYHNYIISDRFIIPPELERYYSEAVLRLPCYQANHKLYDVPVVKLTKAELGLPEAGVVFCCFNASVKITEEMFARWMTILGAVPGSVLWLRGNSDDDFARRLCQEAGKRGINPERLVFLAFRSNTEYLGCHRYADLFLDTFPYSAHTTGSDALRMGLPIITMAGRGFASRVCGSLCHAAGFPDLVCETPQEYLQKAIELGNNPEKLREVKQSLARSLPNCALFDPALLTRELEKLFGQMWSDYCSGTMPLPNRSFPGFGPSHAVGE